jgi:hypothetical protein
MSGNNAMPGEGKVWGAQETMCPHLRPATKVARKLLLFTDLKQPMSPLSNQASPRERQTLHQALDPVHF